MPQPFSRLKTAVRPPTDQNQDIFAHHILLYVPMLSKTSVSPKILNKLLRVPGLAPSINCSFRRPRKLNKSLKGPN
jgi:hypothetical protein